jgi:superfamily II DNA helicase RecQ
VSILFLGPEQLVLDPFKHALTGDSDFFERIFHLSVDECHLLLSWGESFRQPFQQIQVVQDRLDDDVTLTALTATMRGGAALKAMCKFLSLHGKDYHFIRQSNLCNDICITYREVTSSVQGRKFPELDWTLNRDDAVVIFCRTINLGTWVTQYLCQRALQLQKTQGMDPKNQIRTYNSLNWESYNEETRTLIDSEACAIVVGTTTIAFGVDIKCVRTAVVFSDPKDLDEMLQMIGWIHVLYSDGPDVWGLAVVYLNANASERAERVVEEDKAKTKGSVKIAEPNQERRMDITIVKMVLSGCKVDEQN